LLAGFAPRAAEALGRIEYASTAIVVSGHKLADVRHPLDAFGLVVPAIEKRNILAVSFTSRKFPGRAPEGCVQLRTFIGGAMQPELMQLSDDEIRQLVQSELEEILGVTWKPDFTIVARWMRSMPQYHVGHLDLVAAIDRELSAFPRLALAGNAYQGVGIPDSIHSGELAAERVFANP
jgi:oxygen-dependent protoporphyrinogen oxidase